MTVLQFSRSLPSQFPVDGQTRLDDIWVRRLLTTLETRLQPLEGQQDDLDTAIAEVRAVALARINEVLAPAIASVLAIQSRGFLLAGSDTDLTLGNGDVLTWVIDDADERLLFTPSAFVVAAREATADDYALIRTVSYDVETGEYVGEVVSFEGSAGPHDDWQLSAVAGSTIAQVAMLAAGKTARDEAIAARDVSQAIADTLADLVATISDGPIATINGKPGPDPVLAAADILTGGGATIQAVLEDFLTTLDTKASSSGVTSALAAKADAGSVYTKTQANDLLAQRVAAAAIGGDILAALGATDIPTFRTAIGVRSESDFLLDSYFLGSM